MSDHWRAERLIFVWEDNGEQRLSGLVLHPVYLHPSLSNQFNASNDSKGGNQVNSYSELQRRQCGRRGVFELPSVSNLCS